MQAKNKLVLLYYQLVLQEKRVEGFMSHKFWKINNSSIRLIQMERLEHYQSGDAITEEIANWDIAGVSISPKRKWSFRNFNTMDEIRRTSFRDAEVTGQKHSFWSSKSNLCQEITANKSCRYWNKTKNTFVDRYVLKQKLGDLNCRKKKFHQKEKKKHVVLWDAYQNHRRSRT